MRSGDGQDSSASFGRHMCAFVMFQASDVLKDGQAPCVGFQGHLLIEWAQTILISEDFSEPSKHPEWSGNVLPPPLLALPLQGASSQPTLCTRAARAGLSRSTAVDFRSGSKQWGHQEHCQKGFTQALQPLERATASPLLTQPLVAAAQSGLELCLCGSNCCARCEHGEAGGITCGSSLVGAKSLTWPFRSQNHPTYFFFFSNYQISWRKMRIKATALT